MAALYGWADSSRRCVSKAPHGHWKSSTFIGALRLDGLQAPWLIDGPMDGATFLLYARTQLAPTLRKGDIVVCDNLSCHKTAGAREAIEGAGAKLLFLPPYSPDFNPIEMAFSKLKALLRKACARSFESLVDALGESIGKITPQDCLGFFRHAMEAAY